MTPHFGRIQTRSCVAASVVTDRCTQRQTHKPSTYCNTTAHALRVNDDISLIATCLALGLGLHTRTW